MSQPLGFNESSDAMPPRADWLTVIAVAMVAHAVAVSVVHEALGHGGARGLSLAGPRWEVYGH